MPRFMVCAALPGLLAAPALAAEIAAQIRLTRAGGVGTGVVHFSAKSILANKGGVADELKTLYAEPAGVPESPWLGGGR